MSPKKAGDPRPRKDGQPPRSWKRHNRGQQVYVQFRAYNPETGRVEHVKGTSIIFEKYTVQEVYDLITRAGRDAHERARLERVHEDRKTAERLEKEGGGLEGGRSPAGATAAGPADE